MHEFPANSQKAKTRSEPPTPRDRPDKIERVTSTEADRRKRGLGRQVKETFIGGSAQMAFEYMVTEVIIPAIQNTMIDAFQGGIERLIKGEGVRRRGPTHSPYSNVGHVNYQGISTNMRTGRPEGPRQVSRQSRARQTFDEIVIPTRTEAEEVIDRMFDLLSRYGSVSVSDLYEMTGIESTHTDHKWGWTQLRGAKVVRLRKGGFLLDLPEPETLG
jgi:hypothetical protein